ncbi:MAG: acylphosphatase [Salibacteraceae bacterium]
MENPSLIHRKIVVCGKVQGVWFRKSTLEKALEFNVNGWVCNRPDGSVYLEAEGLPQQVEQLHQWCHLGSPQAKVTEVRSESGLLKGFKGFEIRY